MFNRPECCLCCSPGSLVYSRGFHISSRASLSQRIWRGSRGPRWWWCCSRRWPDLTPPPFPSPSLSNTSVTSESFILIIQNTATISRTAQTCEHSLMRCMCWPDFRCMYCHHSWPKPRKLSENITCWPATCHYHRPSQVSQLNTWNAQ